MSRALSLAVISAAAQDVSSYHFELDLTHACFALPPDTNDTAAAASNDTVSGE